MSRLSRTVRASDIRNNLREALRLFREAGWELKNNRLVNAAGDQMRMEILLVSLVRVTSLLSRTRAPASRDRRVGPGGRYLPVSGARR